MHRIAKSFLAALAALAVAFGAFAQSTKPGTEEEAQAMVKKAIAYYQKNGREKAMAEFQKNPGAFVDRDLYISVYNFKGDSLSHINPKHVGKNMIDLRDPDGKYLVRERLEAAKKSSSGWQDYKFFNPVSKKVEPKRMYWEKHDDLIFACGAYKPT